MRTALGTPLCHPSRVPQWQGQPRGPPGGPLQGLCPHPGRRFSLWISMTFSRVATAFTFGFCCRRDESRGSSWRREAGGGGGGNHQDPQTCHQQPQSPPAECGDGTRTPLIHLGETEARHRVCTSMHPVPQGGGKRDPHGWGVFPRVTPVPPGRAERRRRPPRRHRWPSGRAPPPAPAPPGPPPASSAASLSGQNLGDTKVGGGGGGKGGDKWLGQGPHPGDTPEPHSHLAVTE